MPAGDREAPGPERLGQPRPVAARELGDLLGGRDPGGFEEGLHDGLGHVVLEEGGDLRARGGVDARKQLAFDLLGAQVGLEVEAQLDGLAPVQALGGGPAQLEHDGAREAEVGEEHVPPPAPIGHLAVHHDGAFHVLERDARQRLGAVHP
ncbi:hypothetical protein D3C86_1358450 [compost metagenome]